MTANEGRPVPDEDIIRRALRVRELTETPMERYIREEHSAMIGSARVGMDAARKLWPLESDHLGLQTEWRAACAAFETAYEHLDRLSLEAHGLLVQQALLGDDIRVALEEWEDRLKIGPKHEPQNEPQHAPALSEPVPEGGHPVE